jgi:ArsR family transcriptional regulator, lead/cadmium/zinc/bismuth-responsive transcriptional repressor
VAKRTRRSSEGVEDDATARAGVLLLRAKLVPPEPRRGLALRAQLMDRLREGRGLRRKRLPAAAAEAAAGRARALADATRLSLASLLGDGGELCVCDLAWISGRPQNLVSHHLRVLKRQGLAASRREGEVVFYSLTDVGAEVLETMLTTTAVPAAIEGVR